jgi:uncharacterized OsmC-like protein
MPALTVSHLGGDRFAVQVRDHVVHVDQPSDAGGEDSAPTPLELLLASLASCVGHYARRYLARHGLPEEGLAVRATADMGERPARLTTIAISLTVPEGVPAERRDALLAVASACTVHNTLMTPPEVSITLA